jgi:predicted Fe-S protein YdhL (DUF1289 family)
VQAWEQTFAGPGHQFLFSLEKQEWDSLTDQEKQQIADQLDLQNERSTKKQGVGDNKPSR